MTLNIDTLWDKHKGETCLIVGTGPSIAFYPPGFIKSLADHHCSIGLNESYCYLDCKYHISIHYEHIAKRPKLNWITKHKPSDIKLDLSKYIIFKSNLQHNLPVTDFKLAANRSSGSLYVGRGIHTAAMTLAAHMGCSTGILIGADFGSIGPRHHGHSQDVQFHGLEPDQVYNEYYENAVKLREVLYSRFGITFISLSPFLGLHNPERDHVYLDNLYPAITTWMPIKDISTYNRRKVDKFL